MDDAEARAILREHGEDPPRRARLSQKWHDLAEGYRQDIPAADDYDQGVTAGDFGEDAEDEAPSVTEAAPPPLDLPAEQRPRRVRAARPNIRERLRTGTNAKGKAKRKHPRVPVDRLISRAWDMLGGLAARVDPPVGRCLQMEAPVAGLILEDIVKGTMLDRGLQPIARAEDKAEKVLALIGPPLCVAGLEMAQSLPDDQRKMREAILYPLLLESLTLWDRVAGDKADELIVRAERDAPARARAEQLVALIFGPAGPAEPAPEPAMATA